LPDTLPYDEKELLTRIADGDEKAFAQLFREYAPLLQINIHKIVSNDYDLSEVFQETFIKIWLNREKLISIENLRGYFLRIAANECYDYLRKASRRQQVHQQVGVNQNIGDNPEENFACKETEIIIQQAIAKLPPQRKLIYQLSRNQGLSSAEIAGQLQLNRTYVRQTISAAIKHIKDELVAAGKFLLSFSGFF
jgi:RNA polymerase sigma-70 factor (family 1)